MMMMLGLSEELRPVVMVAGEELCRGLDGGEVGPAGPVHELPEISQAILVLHFHGDRREKFFESE